MQGVLGLQVGVLFFCTRHPLFIFFPQSFSLLIVCADLFSGARRRGDMVCIRRASAGQCAGCRRYERRLSPARQSAWRVKYCDNEPLFVAVSTQSALHERVSSRM
jgi:hypothetical protein